MIKLPPKSPLQPLLIRRAVEGIVLIGLAAAVFFAYDFVKTARLDVLTERVAVEEQPKEILASSARRFDLREHQRAIDALERIIIRPDQLGDVVSYLEKTAAAQDVAVNVPDIDEVVEVSPDGVPQRRTGAVFEISLSAVAVGAPDDLIQFIYQIEHAPYLIEAVGWRLETEPRQYPSFFSQPAPNPAASESEQAPQPALLKGDFIITVQNDETPNP